MFKKIIKSIVAVAFVCLSKAGLADSNVDTSNPYTMMQTLADNTFAAIKKNKDRLDDTSVSRGIIRTELLPYIDNKYSSLKVIGTNLKSTNDEQRKKFTAAFTDYIIATYADALKKYTTQTVKVQEPEDIKDDFVAVRVTVMEPGAPDLEVVFKLRLNKKTGQWKIYDLVAEGISLLSAKQSELGGLIREKGIDAVSQQLIDHVNGKTAK